MGVSGSGKTTVGQRLAVELGWPFYDGDDFHPPSNIDKMAAGISLGDRDRWPWLERIRTLILDLRQKKQPAVIACSALKAAYRSFLDAQDDLRVVYLKISPELARERLDRRLRHFMKEAMVESQFRDLEEPQDALIVDAGQEVAAVVAEIRQAIPVP